MRRSRQTFTSPARFCDSAKLTSGSLNWPTNSSFQLTDTVRGWRNFVHPDRARHTPQSNAELADEAGIAALTLRIVLRELGR